MEQKATTRHPRARGAPVLSVAVRLISGRPSYHGTDTAAAWVCVPGRFAKVLTHSIIVSVLYADCSHRSLRYLRLKSWSSLVSICVENSVSRHRRTSVVDIRGHEQIIIYCCILYSVARHVPRDQSAFRSSFSSVSVDHDDRAAMVDPAPTMFGLLVSGRLVSVCYAFGNRS